VAEHTGPGEPANLTGRILERRRRRWRRWLIAAGVLAVLLALAAVAWFSPLLRLEQVRVTGAGRADAGAVEQAILDGYAGTPLPRLPLGRIAQDVLDSEPAVDRAEISYAGPRALRVTLREKVPVALIESGGGEFLVDEHGSSLGEPGEEDQDLPRIGIASGSGDGEAVAAVVRIVGALPQELRERVTGIAAPAPDRVELTLDDGTVVHWGGAEDGELKAEVTLMLLEREPETIDVSRPGTPVTTG
jgi:cell division septal protein FtsQ